MELKGTQKLNSMEKNMESSKSKKNQRGFFKRFRDSIETKFL